MSGHIVFIQPFDVLDEPDFTLEIDLNIGDGEEQGAVARQLSEGKTTYDRLTLKARNGIRWGLLLFSLQVYSVIYANA